MKRGSSARLVLGFFEVGQGRRVAPSRVTQALPVIVIERISSHVNMALIPLDPPNIFPRGQ